MTLSLQAENWEIDHERTYYKCFIVFMYLISERKSRYLEIKNTLN